MVVTSAKKKRTIAVAKIAVVRVEASPGSDPPVENVALPVATPTTLATPLAANVDAAVRAKRKRRVRCKARDREEVVIRLAADNRGLLAQQGNVLMVRRVHKVSAVDRQADSR
jgi:urease accessory protein UreE